MTPKEHEAAIQKAIPEAEHVRVIVPDIISGHFVKPTPVWLATFTVETKNRMIIPISWQTTDPKELVPMLTLLAGPFIKATI